MRRVIRVIKGDAVKVDVVVAIGKAAEKCLAVPEADSIGIYAKGSRRHLHQLAEIGNRRRKILDKRRADFGSGRTRFEQPIHWGGLCGDGSESISLNSNRLGYSAQGQRNREFLRVVDGDP